MIFASTGTNEARFDRLLQWLAEVVSGEELVVQHGPSQVDVPGAECFDFLPFDRLADYVRQARVVVTHAGVGSIMVSLGAGKCPIVVPRLRKLGEAVDDHQLVFARRLAADGLVQLAEDRGSLASAILAGGAPVAAPRGTAAALPDELERYLANRIRAGRDPLGQPVR